MKIIKINFPQPTDEFSAAVQARNEVRLWLQETLTRIEYNDEMQMVGVLHGGYPNDYIETIVHLKSKDYAIYGALKFSHYSKYVKFVYDGNQVS